MTPLIVIVAHAPLATALQQVAQHIFADSERPLLAMDVQATQTPEQVAEALQRCVGEREALLMTDVFGATPSNAAMQTAAHLPAGRCRVVAGVNVPMLWRVLARPEIPLDELVQRAVSGATQGVVHASPTPPQFQAPRSESTDEVHHHDQQ